jgi:hypothetical protein
VSPRPIDQGTVWQRLTRRELVEYLRANGYPISFSTLNRLCAPSCGAGPPMAGTWGGRAFYDPARALAWARLRFGANELRRSRHRGVRNVR